MSRLDELSTESAVDLVASVVGEDAVRGEPEAARELVSLCGNLPLAVRIVSNRLATGPEWSLAGLVRELRDERIRLDSLSAGDENLRAAFAVSYQMPPGVRRANPNARERA